MDEPIISQDLQVRVLRAIKKMDSARVKGAFLIDEEWRIIQAEGRYFGHDIELWEIYAPMDELGDQKYRATRNYTRWDISDVEIEEDCVDANLSGEEIVKESSNEALGMGAMDFNWN